MRAALIYQHATSERDREIAAALNLRIGRESGENWHVRGPAGEREESVEVNSENESRCGSS